MMRIVAALALIALSIEIQAQQNATAPAYRPV